LTKGSDEAFTIVLNDIVVDKTATMTIVRNRIMTQTDVMTIFTKTFHLVADLLGNAT